MARARWKHVLAGAIAVQCIATVIVLFKFETQDQVRVAIGTESLDEFLTGSLAIYRANKYIQTLPKDSRIALYDEVFGFYVDRDYFWANPGHSMLIPYESMQSASDYVIAMRRLGFTHIYINLFTGDMRFPAAIGYGTDLLPYSEEERSAMMLNLDLRWKVLLADASAQGLIRPQATFGMSVVFSIDL